MQAALDELVTLLALEPIEVNIFRGRSPDENRQRVFGGQVAGQALVAAARTVDEPARLVHSLHAYFLRPGDPTVPILYEVDRLRDGRSFSTRRVVAIQHGRAIFNLQASFHAPEPGPDHQMTMPPGIPDPESLEDWHTRMAPYKEQMGDWYDRPRPIDVRYVDGDPISRKGVPTDSQRVWLRADGHLPDDPVVHACIVTYASDMSLLDTTVLPFGLAWDSPGMQMASLDHAMWFHRPFRADEWLLYDQHALSTGSARGLAGGAVVLGRRTARRERRPGGPGEGRSMIAARRVVALTAALGLVVIAACSDDDDDATSPTATAATSAPVVASSGAPTTTASSTAVSNATVPATTTPSSTHSRVETTPAPQTGNEPRVTLAEIGTFDTPVDLVWRPGDDAAMYVVQKTGTILRVDGSDSTTVLDISADVSDGAEQGLLGLAFDPTGQRAYIDHTDRDGNTMIDEHTVGADGTFAPEPRRLLAIDQPYPNHNGGQVVFGPDGMLYIGMGDGGAGGDPERRASNPAELLGKILRIDPTPSATLPYTVPPDNPFVADAGTRPEIWATGLRNPWRFSFDAVTGDLWIGDVGQDAVEEIDAAPATAGRDAGKGLFFGWSALEGDQPYNDDVPAAGATPPFSTYRHGARLLDQRRCPGPRPTGPGPRRVVRLRRLLRRSRVGARGPRRWCWDEARSAGGPRRAARDLLRRRRTRRDGLRPVSAGFDRAPRPGLITHAPPPRAGGRRR